MGASLASQADALGIEFFSVFYKNRIRYQTPATGLTLVGIIVALLLLPFGNWYAVAGFFGSSLTIAAVVAWAYTMDP
jgi:hypothetical protein